MCIPPVDDAPAPHFALTAKIAARNGLKNLSMGMSADFAIAIQFGATPSAGGFGAFSGRVARHPIGRECVVPAEALIKAPRANDASAMTPPARAGKSI